MDFMMGLVNLFSIKYFNYVTLALKHFFMTRCSFVTTFLHNILKHTYTNKLVNVIFCLQQTKYFKAELSFFAT